MMLAFIPAPGSTAAGPPLYPDLRTPPPFNLYFEQGYDGQWRLRFANTVSNHGGPLEITVDSNKRIYQNVYDALWGGSIVSSTRVGSDLIFHPTHNHFHFADFARYDLLVKDSRGAYRRSPRQSQKTTFCILDYQRVNAPGPSSPGYTTCGAQVQGLSAGWGDTYMADLPDQWIVLGSSRLANGDYAIQSTADPYNKLRETDESNNQGIVYFSVQNGQIVATGQPPTCRTSPESAPVGAIVSLTCERFGNSEPVDIRWGGPSTTPLQTVNSTGAGRVDAMVTIPEGGIGNHYIIATGQNSGTVAASIFNTSPSITRQFWNRVVGSTTGVTLRGWSPGELVTVTFNTAPGSNPQVGSTVVDSLGSGSLQITIPVTTIGRHDITATGSSSGRSATAVINVNPSSLLVPTTASSGEQVGLSLRGYASRESVRLTINGNEIGRVQASASGSTTASSARVTLPATLAIGTYTVVSTGVNSGGSSSASIEIVGISLAEEPTQPPATPEPEGTPASVETPSGNPDETPTETPSSETPVNMAPTANAGPDQSIEDADADGFAEVLLDGTRSVDPEGDVLNVVWTLPDGDDLDLDADEIATGLSPTVRLPVGITTVTLKVTDAAGNIATDEVKITVISAADAESSLAGTPTGE
jgi:hypothetical protein